MRCVPRPRLVSKREKEKAFEEDKDEEDGGLSCHRRRSFGGTENESGEGNTVRDTKRVSERVSQRGAVLTVDCENRKTFVPLSPSPFIDHGSRQSRGGERLLLCFPVPPSPYLYNSSGPFLSDYTWTSTETSRVSWTVSQSIGPTERTVWVVGVSGVEPCLPSLGPTTTQHYRVPFPIPRNWTRVWTDRGLTRPRTDPPATHHRNRVLWAVVLFHPLGQRDTQGESW